jgi:hypothetical protein
MLLIASSKSSLELEALQWLKTCATLKPIFCELNFEGYYHKTLDLQLIELLTIRAMIFLNIARFGML